MEDILARLLLPEQFGLIAMLAIFIAIPQSFIDSGFGAALIQKQDVTYIDECSIFYFNILVGFLAAGRYNGGKRICVSLCSSHCQSVSSAACANYDRDRALYPPLLHLPYILFYGSYRDSQINVAQPSICELIINKDKRKTL